MGLVEDEHRARREHPQPVTQRRGVLLFAQQGVRDDEARVGVPWIDAEALFPTTTGDVLAVENLKAQTEAGIEFITPLQHNRWRRADNDATHLLAHQHLAQNEAGLDGLSQADVVGDEQVYTRQFQGFAKRFELVRLDVNASAIGSLKQTRVRRRHAAPALGVQVGGKHAGLIEATGGDRLPRAAVNDLGVEFTLPQNLQGHPLGVVIEARQPNQGLMLRLRWRDNVLDEVLAGPDPHDLSNLWRHAALHASPNIVASALDRAITTPRSLNGATRASMVTPAATAMWRSRPRPNDAVMAQTTSAGRRHPSRQPRQPDETEGPALFRQPRVSSARSHDVTA
jgi:hypothetical protein